MLPLELILVRHGNSEGNEANAASRAGDNQFFTPKFRDRHSADFRLTDQGREQPKAAGTWLREHIELPLDRYYVSTHLRAMETASLLDLPDAQWRLEFHLRERDMALMDNLPADEKTRRFAEEERQWQLNRFLSYPAGGGESVAQLCARLKSTMMEHWARECANKRIIVVSHGHVMRALQIEIESLLPDDFIRMDESNDPRDKIRNCQILWYSRKDPWTGEEHPHIVAVRSVCPWDPDGDYGWRKIPRRKWSNEELIAEVTKTPRIIGS